MPAWVSVWGWSDISVGNPRDWNAQGSRMENRRWIPGHGLSFAASTKACHYQTYCEFFGSYSATCELKLNGHPLMPIVGWSHDERTSCEHAPPASIQEQGFGRIQPYSELIAFFAWRIWFIFAGQIILAKLHFLFDLNRCAGETQIWILMVCPANPGFQLLQHLISESFTNPRLA